MGGGMGGGGALGVGGRGQVLRSPRVLGEHTQPRIVGPVGSQMLEHVLVHARTDESLAVGALQPCRAGGGRRSRRARPVNERGELIGHCEGWLLGCRGRGCGW